MISVKIPMWSLTDPREYVYNILNTVDAPALQSHQSSIFSVFACIPRSLANSAKALGVERIQNVTTAWLVLRLVLTKVR
jgi:hypothetical protein